jgi:hypothetical protein
VLVARARSFGFASFAASLAAALVAAAGAVLLRGGVELRFSGGVEALACLGEAGLTLERPLRGGTLWAARAGGFTLTPV